MSAIQNKNSGCPQQCNSFKEPKAADHADVPHLLLPTICKGSSRERNSFIFSQFKHGFSFAQEVQESPKSKEESEWWYKKYYKGKEEI